MYSYIYLSLSLYIYIYIYIYIHVVQTIGIVVCCDPLRDNLHSKGHTDRCGAAAAAAAGPSAAPVII